MARENRLWNWLSKTRVHYGPALHLGRVENAVGAGHPDVEGYLHGGGQLWIELKSAARPVKPETPVDLKHARDSQVEWHRRRQKAGQRTWFLIQVGSGADAARYLIPGTLAEELQKGQTEAWLRYWSQVDPKAKPHHFIEACLH